MMEKYAIKTRVVTLLGLTAGLSLCLATGTPSTTYAGFDVSFGATVQLGDDTDVYLAVSSQYYDQDERDVQKWDRQYKDSDDLAVALFLSRHGHKSPAKMHLSDGDAQNLVAVRMLHEYYAVSVEVAMEWRSSGQDLAKITAGEYRSRHGKSDKNSNKVAANSQGKK